MNKDEFKEWYNDNIELMAKLGVLHPDSPFGKTVYLAVSSIQPQLDAIYQQLNEINKKLGNETFEQPVIKKTKKKQIVLESNEKQPEVSLPKQVVPKKKYRRNIMGGR